MSTKLVKLFEKEFRTIVAVVTMRELKVKLIPLDDPV